MNQPAGYIKIWCRVSRGLEWVAAAEASMLPDVVAIKTSHRNLFFECLNTDTADKLRCIDDAYVIWGQINGIDHKRAALECIASGLDQLPDIDMSIKSLKKLRVTASVLGKHNYSRYEIEDQVGQVIANRLNLIYMDSKSPDVQDALWCRVHITKHKLLIGFRVRPEPLHRRFWRTNGIAGALHPPVAAAIAFLADLHPGQCVVDPFCGSGTLLIEAGLQTPQLKLKGYDIADKSVDHAFSHARQAGVSLILTTADSSNYRLTTADRIITNPPWGCAVKAAGGLDYGNIISTIFKNLSSDGRAVLLMDIDVGLPELLQQSGLKPLLIENVRLAGRLTQLIIIGPMPVFQNTESGKYLANAWQKYRVCD